MKRASFAVVAVIAIGLLGPATTLQGQHSHAPQAPATQIAGELGTLASDAMRGRGSGTVDELRAARYLARKLRQIGIFPMGDAGGYIQNISGIFNFRGGPKPWHTRNVIGVLKGSDAKLKNQVVLLTAHMDHLGVGTPVNGDSIYNGADDDASGCVAVLQLGRALATGKRPKRTVLFVFFGSEETGGQGDRYFLRHPPLPLDHIVANLEFEMIGRPDSAVQPGELWLTGYERSNLGPELARHGARLVADPHPERSFFSARTILPSPNAASSRRQSPVTACIATITSPATIWPTSISNIWNRRLRRWWGRWSGWRIRISSRSGWRGKHRRPKVIAWNLS